MSGLAKLTRPKMHRAIPRERLFAQLDQLREQALVWVTAPPGSGKTTLVASYLEARKLRCLWYHIDAGDHDIGTFFHYLAQSLPSTRKKQAALPVLTPEYRVDLPGFCRLFFRAFFARLTPEHVIAFDNYHELPPTSAMHQVLACAIAELPQTSNIICISRADPPRELMPLRLNDRLGLLEWGSLRMSLEETRAVAASRVDVDDKTLRRIYRLSDGWAAGVTLTLQRLRQSAAGHDEQHAREELFDYFATQVFNAAPPDTQEFLRRTSLLPTVNAAMADELLERSDSDAVLDELYRHGAFIDRRSMRPPTYQYHDLFRAFLQTQLAQFVSGAEFTALQSSAAALLERVGQSDNAVRLYLQCGDVQSAARLIVNTAPNLIAQGRGATLREWISALPTHIMDENPWISYWSGAAISRVQPIEARSSFERALAVFEARGDIIAQRLLCAEIIITYMHEFANLIPLDDWLDRLQPLLDDPTPYPSVAAELQVRTAHMFALGFRRPDAERLQQSAARVLEMLDEPIPAELSAMAIGIVIMHLYLMGDIQASARAAERFKALQEASQLMPVSSALGSMQVGHAAFRGGDREAIHLFNRALDLGHEHSIPLPTLYVYSHLGLAFCAIERGDLLQADLHRRKIEAHWIPSRKIDRVAAARVQLWIACHRGDYRVALDIARRHVDAAHECGLFQLIFESHILLAILCAELDMADEFAEALAPVRPQVAGTALAHFAYLADLTEAYFALRRGDQDLCHQRLATGFAMSKLDQGMFVLRMQAHFLPRLAAEALRGGIETSHVTHIIRDLDLKPPAGAIEWPWPLRIHTFGRFEVLREGQPLEFSRKAPKKTLALLKALIAFGGKNVREQLLLDTFWADEDGDVAERSLTATLHRLRTLIGDTEFIVSQGGALSLDRSRVWVDVWAFEDLLADPAKIDSSDLLSLYQGGFLKEDEHEAWTVTARERLRGKFIHTLGAVASALERQDRCELAIECYLRGLDADPVIEQFYQGLMRCYARLDRKSEAIAAYRRLRQMLSVSLSIAPSPTTEKLYSQLRLG